tara:strand:+ start:360 stop:1640 length:1281 start_codon:yes stop_codon:yes gene_type:complete
MSLIIKVIKYLIVILSTFTLISFVYETVINKIPEDNHFTDAPKVKKDLITKLTTVSEDTVINKKSEGNNHIDVPEQKQNLLAILTPISETTEEEYSEKTEKIIGCDGIQVTLSTVSQDPHLVKKRDRDISEWIEVRDYQKYFDTHFRNSKYPIYIETDMLGRRRMIWVKRPNNFKVGVKTNRTKEKIEKLHNEKSSQGNTILAVYEFERGEIKTYNLVWIESEHIPAALIDLNNYGVSQAKIINKIEDTNSTPVATETKEIQSNKLEWGRHGDGIEIQNNLMIRNSDLEHPYRGSISKAPVISNTPINISLILGENQNNFHYIGLSSREINVNKWTLDRPEQYCLYFTSGQNWSGIHDSSLKVSDWRNGVVPPLKSSDVLTITYKQDEGTIVFKRGDEILYVGNGYDGDLYLSGFVRFKNEGIKIH